MSFNKIIQARVQSDNKLTYPVKSGIEPQVLWTGLYKQSLPLKTCLTCIASVSFIWLRLFFQIQII